MHILFFSSFLFLLPVLYGFYLSCYYQSILAFLTFLCSINYWRDPLPGWRRDTDIYLATYVFIHIFYHIWYYVNSPISYFCYYTIIQSYILYRVSCMLYEINDPYWYKYHILMHVFCNIGTILTMYEIYS
jgi:hypothetical protein